MRKITIIFSLLLIVMGCIGQTVINNTTIATANLGHDKLVKLDLNGTESYVMLVKNGNQYDTYVEIGLGSKEDALRQLSFMVDNKFKKGTMIVFDTDPDCKAVWQGDFLQYKVYGIGNIMSATLMKSSIRKFVKSLNDE